MDPPEGTQVGPERRARPLTGVAVDLASAIAIIIPRPLVHAVADRGMGRMAAPIALPFVGIELRAASRHVLRDQGTARARVRMVADPEALLARVPRDDTDDGRTIVGVGAVPFALIGAPAGRIRGVAMGRAFFPPRSGTVRRPQRPCRSSHRSVRSRSGWLGCAAAGYGAVCVTAPTRAPGVPWARPWQCRAATAPGSLGAAGFSQRPSRSAGCNSPRRPDSGRPESGLVHGTGAVRGCPQCGHANPCGWR